MKLFKIVILTASLFLSTLSLASHMNISSLSFNLHCFDNNWKKRLDILAKEIAVLSPTILSFQEVCTSDSENMISYLEEQLKKEGYPLSDTHEIFTHRAWDKYDEYIVMMTKENVEAKDSGLLPPSPLQRAYVALQVQGIYFINTHLEHLDPQYRKDEINYLIHKFSGRPHILMGDLNSNPQNEEQASLLQNNYRPYFAGPTYPSQKPTFTYDGFWVSPLVSNSHLGNAKTVLNKSYNGLFLSDHVGVLFQIPSR